METRLDSPSPLDEDFRASLLRGYGNRALIRVVVVKLRPLLVTEAGAVVSFVLDSDRDMRPLQALFYASDCRATSGIYPGNCSYTCSPCELHFDFSNFLIGQFRV